MVQADRPEIRALCERAEQLGFDTVWTDAFLVYFYPKADTPGCTKQACGLRDVMRRWATRSCSE